MYSNRYNRSINHLLINVSFLNQLEATWCLNVDGHIIYVFTRDFGITMHKTYFKRSSSRIQQGLKAYFNLSLSQFPKCMYVRSERSQQIVQMHSHEPLLLDNKISAKLSCAGLSEISAKLSCAGLSYLLCVICSNLMH